MVVSGRIVRKVSVVTDPDKTSARQTSRFAGCWMKAVRRNAAQISSPPAPASRQQGIHHAGLEKAKPQNFKKTIKYPRVKRDNRTKKFITALPGQGGSESVP